MTFLQKLKQLIVPTAETRAARQLDTANRAATAAWLAKGGHKAEDLDISSNQALAHYLTPTAGEVKRKQIQKIAMTGGKVAAGLMIAGVVGVFGTIAYSSVLATYAINIMNIGVVAGFTAMATKLVCKQIDRFHRTSAAKRQAQVTKALSAYAQQPSAAVSAASKLDISSQKDFNTTSPQQKQAPSVSATPAPPAPPAT